MPRLLHHISVRYLTRVPKLIKQPYSELICVYVNEHILLLCLLFCEGNMILR